MNFKRGGAALLVCLWPVLVVGQLTDRTQAPNTAKAGIAKWLEEEEIGPGCGDVMTPGSSIYIIERDQFRSVRRGRQLFQRKFTRVQGQGPSVGDGAGDLNTNPAIGAGLSDSCAVCHGRPKARPVSRSSGMAASS